MNSLELKKDPSGKFITIINSNGVEAWEIHREGLSEIDILTHIKERKYFQDIKGAWIFTLPDDKKVFRDDSFDKNIGMAISYINFRDHPHWEDHF